MISFPHAKLECHQDRMTGNVVVDGRNIYDRQELAKQVFDYTWIGEIWNYYVFEQTY